MLKEWLNKAIREDHIRYINYAEFENVRSVARGAFGEVSKARWKSGDKDVALKALLDNHNSGTEESFESFIRELKFLRHVDFCDNIIRFYGVSLDQTSARYFMVIQYANGGNLRDFLRNNFDKLDWVTKISMGRHIVIGLNAIHSKKILHRDLHSKNIVIHDGRIMITDFGLSKSSLVSSDSVVTGMAAYVEPKCFKDPKYLRNEASDIYSLGVLLWEISSGRPPFNGLGILDIAAKVVKREREDPFPGTPIEYVALYKQAWDHEPNNRPPLDNIRDRLNAMLIARNVDPLEQSCLDALKVVSKKNNNSSNTPKNIGTPIVPPLGRINTNMAAMSINDQNRPGTNNNNINRPPERPVGATNLNQINNFEQGNNQPNPQVPRTVVGQHPIPINNPQHPVPINNPQHPIPINNPQHPMPINNPQHPMPINNPQRPMPINNHQHQVPNNIVQTRPNNPNFTGQIPHNNQMPPNPNFTGQIPHNNQMPPNNPNFTGQIPHNNQMPPNNPNFTGQIPHNNQVPANIPAQNFTRQNVTQNPMPIHNLPGKNHLSQQQPVVVNNLGQNLNQQPFTGNYNQPRGYPQTNQNHIALKSAPVIPIVNQRSIPPKPAALSGGQQINHGNSIQYLNTNPNPIPSNINNIGPGPGGNPTVNVQGNPQSRQNTYTHTQPIHSNMPQNFQPPNGVNLGPSGQNATGFIQQNHNIVPNSGMQTPGAAPNSGRQTPVTLNSGGGKPPNSGGQPPNSGGQPPNSGGQPPNTTPIQTPNAPNSGSKQFPFPNGNSAYLTSVINIKCPMIQQCIEVKERYKKEFGTVLGYEDTEECHTGYHAGFGDVVGLRHHFYYGAKVNGDSLFTNTRENLVIIAARYCSRRKLIEIFKLLKEYNANFKRVSNSTGKTPLHCLYENTSFAKDLNDHKGLQKFHKYMKEAIEFLVDNGCNINAMDHGRQTLLSYYLSDRFRHKETTPIILTLLKKGADPNIPSKVTIASYNAPNALFLAVKIGWSIEVLDALLNRGARVDIKDDNGDNLLVLAAKEKQSDSKKPFDTINWILETIPEASTRDCVEAAMKILDRKYRNKLSKWKGSDGESRRRLVQENLELKKQLRTETESSKEQESVSD